MLDKTSRKVRVTVVDVVVVVISSSDQWALPHHCDGVGSGAGFEDSEVATS